MSSREDIETSLQKALEHEESRERSAPPFAEDPELMAELAPLLEVVGMLRASAPPAPEPSPIARAAARNRFLIAVHHRRLRASLPARAFHRLQDIWASRYHWLYGGIWPAARRWAPAMIGVLLAIVLSSRAYYVSADSLPGDALYPVKRVAEQVQLLTTLNADAKARLRVQFNDRRLSETQQLLENSRVEEVQFQGIIEEVFPDRLRINGLIVRLEGSRVGGAPAVGAVVLVTAITQPSQELLAITVAVLEEAPAEATATPPKRAPTPTRRLSPARPQGGRYATRVPTRPPQPTALPTAAPTASSLPAGGAAVTVTLVASPELTPLVGTPEETVAATPLDAVPVAPTSTGQGATPTPIPSETPVAPTATSAPELPTVAPTLEPTAAGVPEVPTAAPTEPSSPPATPLPAPTAEPPTLEPPPTAAPGPPTAPPEPPTAAPAPPTAPTSAPPEPPTAAPPAAPAPEPPPTPAPEERSL